jgi:hypothetical protein
MDTENNTNETLNGNGNGNGYSTNGKEPGEYVENY